MAILASPNDRKPALLSPPNLEGGATARSRKMNSALNGGIGTIIMNVFVGVLVLETVIYSIASI
jgi:hypothetical protein